MTFRWRLLRVSLTGGKQHKRVDVPVRVGGQPDAEMDVRLGPFRIAARADRPHDLALTDRCADSECDRAQVDEGDRVAVCRADRQAETLARKLPGEGDDSGRRSAHIGSRRRADVHPTVLAAGVRVALGDERPQHRPLDRPRPGGRARGVHERNEEHRAQDCEFVA